MTTVILFVVGAVYLLTAAVIWALCYIDQPPSRFPWRKNVWFAIGSLGWVVVIPTIIVAGIFRHWRK